jgi:hypothetical protein
MLAEGTRVERNKAGRHLDLLKSAAAIGWTASLAFASPSIARDLTPEVRARLFAPTAYVRLEKPTLHILLQVGVTATPFSIAPHRKSRFPQARLTVAKAAQEPCLGAIALV